MASRSSCSKETRRTTPGSGSWRRVDHGITLPLPDWAPVAAAQVMLLGAYDATDDTLRGTVVYPAAFDGLD